MVQRTALRIPPSQICSFLHATIYRGVATQQDTGYSCHMEDADTEPGVLVTETVAAVLESILDHSPEGVHAYKVMTETNKAAGTFFGAVQRLVDAHVVETRSGTYEGEEKQRTLYFIPADQRLAVADACQRARELYRQKAVAKKAVWRRSHLGLPRLQG